jgi:hypothetical protein
MDNGAYEKYKLENPDVYTPLSTYDYLNHVVHQMTIAELIICVIAAVLAVFAVYKIFTKQKDQYDEDKRKQDKQ